MIKERSVSTPWEENKRERNVGGGGGVAKERKEILLTLIVRTGIVSISIRFVFHQYSLSDCEIVKTVGRRNPFTR